MISCKVNRPGYEHFCHFATFLPFVYILTSGSVVSFCCSVVLTLILINKPESLNCGTGIA